MNNQNVIPYSPGSLSSQNSSSQSSSTPSEKKPLTITISLMVRNEQDKILETLNDYNFPELFSSIFILDTGSTDNTIEQIISFSKSSKIPVTVLQKPFIDFSTNRNFLLEYIYENSTSDFILLIDTNDYLRTADGKPAQKLFYDFVQTFSNLEKMPDHVYMNQVWNTTEGSLFYKNCRLIANNKKTEYKFKVHEYPTAKNNENILNLLCSDLNSRDPSGNPDPSASFILFQNREPVYERQKELERLPRDEKMFLEEITENPLDARTTYYLAQTYYIAGDWVNCIKWCKRRIDLSPRVVSSNPEFPYPLTCVSGMTNVPPERVYGTEQNPEEVHTCMIRIAKSMMALKYPFESVRKWLWRAWDYMKEIEPIIILASDAMSKNDYLLAYSLLLLSLSHERKYKMLPIPQRLYTFDRYAMMAEVCYKLKKYDEVKLFAQKVLESGGSGAVGQKLEEDSKLVENIQSYVHNISELERIGSERKISKMMNKQTVVIYAPPFYDGKKWDGEKVVNGEVAVGGSEMMVIRLANVLANTLKSLVIVVTDTDKITTFNKVHYVPEHLYENVIMMGIPSGNGGIKPFNIDHLIVSRDASKIAYGEHIKNVHLWLHDLVHMGGNNFRDHETLKSIWVLSEFHRNYYYSILNEESKKKLEGKLKILPNFVENFPEISMDEKGKETEGQSVEYVYISCPSRGLEEVLNYFQKNSGKILHLFADFSNSYVKSVMNVEGALKVIEKMPNVKYYGKLPRHEMMEKLSELNQSRLESASRELATSSRRLVWFYPTNFLETFCISAVDMMSLGIIPVYRAIGALPEIVGEVGISFEKDIPEDLDEKLENLDWVEERKKAMKQARKWNQAKFVECLRKVM